MSGWDTVFGEAALGLDLAKVDAVRDSLGHVLASVLAVVRRHHLCFPSNLALLAKTLGMCEGLAAHLDPQFRMTEAITPYVAQLLASPPSDASLD